MSNPSMELDVTFLCAKKIPIRIAWKNEAISPIINMRNEPAATHSTSEMRRGRELGSIFKSLKIPETRPFILPLIKAQKRSRQAICAQKTSLIPAHVERGIGGRRAPMIPILMRHFGENFDRKKVKKSEKKSCKLCSTLCKLPLEASITQTAL